MRRGGPGSSQALRKCRLIGVDGQGLHPGPRKHKARSRRPQKQTPHRPTRPPGRLGQHQGTRGSCYLSLSSKGLAPPRRQRRWRPDSASRARSPGPRVSRGPAGGSRLASGCVIFSLGWEVRCCNTALHPVTACQLCGSSNPRQTPLLAVLPDHCSPPHDTRDSGPGATSSCTRLAHSRCSANTRGPRGAHPCLTDRTNVSAKTETESPRQPGQGHGDDDGG